MTKKYYLATLGCPKNEIDSEALEADLRAAGLALAENSDCADLIVVNSCGFINNAKVETIHTVLELHQDRKPGSVMVLCGCLPARYNLSRSLDEVDIFLPWDKHHELIPILQEIGWSVGKKADEFRRLAPCEPFAYLRISEGCDNRCAYCAIPDIRGPFRSRNSSDIIGEAEFLSQNGAKELILIGQDTTLYGRNAAEEISLPILMRKLSGIEACEWIRLMYAHPAHLTNELIETMANLNKVVRYIDLPLQHISDRILKLMNRKVTGKTIEAVIDKLRRNIPGIALRTTFIVGFPGETDSEFGELLDFMEAVEFDNVGAFKYSPEDGTQAYKLPGRVKDAVVEERYLTLLDIQNMISRKKLEARLGNRDKVLLHHIGQDGRGMARAHFQAPEVDGQVIIENCLGRPGEFVDIVYKRTDAYDLYASQ